ncbi:MAG TPA: hypothetical protein VK034_00450, partial [Enhygromyxa sp.]|nr:hypothetical protein [Enhygromyxa sp.]
LAVWAHAHMQQERLEKVDKKTSWGQSVGNDERGLYDQSTVMVRAIESVKTDAPTDQKPANPTGPGETDVRNLKSGHHWRIGPIKSADENKKETRDLLSSTSDYKAALIQDMTQRQANSDPASKSQLERIMEIMAETPAGQAVIDAKAYPLPGYESAAKGYEDAMIEVLGSDKALEEMRDRVRKVVIEPYSEASLTDKKERDLKTRLRMRGHHL